MESSWIQNLQGFGRRATQEESSVLASIPPPLPLDWSKLVEESREYMRLFRGVEQRDPEFLWSEFKSHNRPGKPS